MSVSVGMAVSAFCIALVYVGGPLLIWWSQKFEVAPKMVPFDPDVYEWPPDVHELFSDASRELCAAGFEVEGGVLLPSAVDNVQTALVLLVNRGARDQAMLVAMVALTNFIKIKSLYVEFTTTFEDGVEYNTNNCSQIGVFPPEPHKRTYQFVQVQEPSRLYEIHNKIQISDGRFIQSKILGASRGDDDGVHARLLKDMREEYDMAAKRGYLYLASDGQFFRPTIMGSILMCWKQLWPWQLIRLVNRMRCSHSMLRRLEVA